MILTFAIEKHQEKSKIKYKHDIILLKFIWIHKMKPMPNKYSFGVLFLVDFFWFYFSRVLFICLKIC